MEITRLNFTDNTLRIEFGDASNLIRFRFTDEQVESLREQIGGEQTDLSEIQDKVRELHDLLSTSESNLRSAISDARDSIDSADSALNDAESDFSTTLDELESLVEND